jgi:hypothetical protein
VTAVVLAERRVQRLQRQQRALLREILPHQVSLQLLSMSWFIEDSADGMACLTHWVSQCAVRMQSHLSCASNIPVWELPYCSEVLRV